MRNSPKKNQIRQPTFKKIGSFSPGQLDRQLSALENNVAQAFEGCRGEAFDLIRWQVSSPPSRATDKDVRVAFGQLLLCDPTLGPFNVTLPMPASEDTGRRVAVKNASSNANAITVLPRPFYVGAQLVQPLIDGAPSSVLSAARMFRVFTWLGAQYGWMIG